MTVQAALARIKAYVGAVRTLYDTANPMPDKLTIDTAYDYDKPLRTPAVDLLYDDLKKITDESLFDRDAMKRAFCAGIVLNGGMSNNERVDKGFHDFMIGENLNG